MAEDTLSSRGDDVTSETGVGPSDQSGWRLYTDGGGARLRLGASAEAIGRPDDVFATLDGRFLLVSEKALGWSIVTDNEVEPGVVEVGGLSEGARAVLQREMNLIDIEELATELAAETALDEMGARVLLLFEGFEFEPDEIAAELDIAERDVRDHLRSVYDQYDEDAVAARVHRHHPDLPEEVVRAFVLADGLGWDETAVADELDMVPETVRAHLETAREQHDDLMDTLRQVMTEAT